ncbi:hypothetical protein ACWHAM_20290 [Paenibacillus terrae]|uniref:Uncharacterized protein n=1 Tax=Paenibacillus terrae (strain HPL-003) TaxID=985665 RepID=G7VSC9_PAETH|nr:hypothetical protein [Paenibacillus terrae]AET62138.1 hypothetical protein HPL003_27130 [Paenibacillus terrae HPL-003]
MEAPIWKEIINIHMELQSQIILLWQKTQADIAQELGITKQQLHNYKKLLTLIPELQDMVVVTHYKAFRHR